MPHFPRRPEFSERIGKLIKFCLVGGSGVGVDMMVLYLLGDKMMFGLNLTVAKICSAEAAMLNNFVWNELWTFRYEAGRQEGGVVGRLVRFHAICGVGIGLAVVLLRLFTDTFGISLYCANLLAIILVTFWNFIMNAFFNWRMPARTLEREDRD